jgi:hypothetical protein
MALIRHLVLMHRFMCHEKVGERTGEGAVWLTSVPEGMRVYGSGEAATFISQVYDIHRCCRL